MNPTERRLADCQQIIGYYFSNPRLLETALTHSSLRAPDRECNERLEFLGDSVLGLVITEELYHLLPDQSEGELTRIKSAVVSRSALLSTSQQLGLQGYAEFARGVGRRDKLPASVVANLVEAIIGAIYLDAGYYPAREFVLRHMGEAIDDELNDRGAKNYKSLLQHEVQQSVGVTPTYRTLDADGPDHAKEFVVAAIIRGQEWGQANGPTKKDAEQEAARMALEGWERRGRGRRRRRKRKGSDADVEVAGDTVDAEAAAPEAADDTAVAAEPEAPAPRVTATTEAPDVAPPSAAAAHDDGEARPRRRKKRARRRRKPDATLEDMQAADAAAIEAESAADEPAPAPVARRAPEAPRVPAAAAAAAESAPPAPEKAPASEKAPRRERRRSRRAPKPADAAPQAAPEGEPEVTAPAAPRAAAPSAPQARPEAAAETAPQPQRAREPRPKPAPKQAAPKQRAPKAGAPSPKRSTPSAFGAGIDGVQSEPAPARAPAVKRKKVAAPARKPAPAPQSKPAEGGFGAGI